MRRQMIFTTLALVCLMIWLVSAMPLTTVAAPRSPATYPSRSIVNTSFEQPNIAQAPCTLGATLQFVPMRLVPGWGTTHPAGVGGIDCGGTSADAPIEIWRGFGGVSSADGSQHAELNAHVASTLYQRVCLAANEQVPYSFYHRGRNGNDTARASLQDDSGNIIGANSQDVTTGNTAWVQYSGTFTNDATPGVRRFAFGAVDSTGGDPGIGNFLDAITISLAPLFDIVAFTNNSGTPTPTVAESVGTHYLQVLVNGDIVGNPASVTLTRSGTATFGSDYTVGATTNRTGVTVSTDGAGNITLNLPVGVYDASTDAGTQPGQIRIPINVTNDTNYESTETIIYTVGSITHNSGVGRDLQSQIGGLSAACAAPVGSATLNVTNDDLAVPTVTLISSRNPSTFGEAVTFTCTVSGNAGTPTGTVQIFAGTTLLGTRTLNASGQATLTTSALAVGSHAMRCEYDGDNTYASGIGRMTQVVNQPAPAEVPEASTLLLMGGGLGGVGVWLRYQWARRKKIK